jgi:hypothetical protein
MDDDDMTILGFIGGSGHIAKQGGGGHGSKAAKKPPKHNVGGRKGGGDAAPKAAKPKGLSGLSSLSDIKKEEVLQAVILADSFAVRFRPFTAKQPKVLLPLVNVPMLEYALEFLCTNKVQEVFIFCCAHAAQVTGYINNSHWYVAEIPVIRTIILSLVRC